MWTGTIAAETVKVGLPVPLTGFVAESAKEMVEGFTLYLKQSKNKWEFLIGAMILSQALFMILNRI